MKHSIKKQLIVNFTAIFIAIALVFILCDFFLLRNFFVFSKYNNIRKVYEKICLAAEKDSIQSQDFLLEFRTACMENNLSGTVTDEDGSVIITLGSDAFDSLPEEDLISDNLKKTDKYSVNYFQDAVNTLEYIELKGDLLNGNTIVLRSSLASVKNAVRVSNTFLLTVAFFAVLVGIGAILLVSRRITKPVLELTQISDKMANLDFDAKYKGEGENELDRLGDNMNRVSEKLENTLEELKEANTELKKEIVKKEEIENMRREFVANASHELKTPIALIQGYAEGLKEGIIDDPKNRDFYCDVIVDEAGKMNALVKTLMTLYELEMGKTELSTESFDISEMITNQIQTMSVLAQNKEATVEYDAEAIWVVSDEFKAEEVFRNYLSNAIAHAKGEKKISITTVKKNENLRISIFNTGDRIPDESIPKLWDKFYKVDKARTREYGGSGVGLSIVKATMELLGGEYGVENKENGVLFYFELPLKES